MINTAPFTLPQDKINFNSASALNTISMCEIDHVSVRCSIAMFDTY